MNPPEDKLLTIVAEAALERSLVADLDRLGVGGYTITDARGRGSRGRRSSGWEHSGNVRIELDNTSRISYEGPLSLVITYAADNPAPRTLRGVGTWHVPKHDMQGHPAEWIKMTAAIESRPE